MTVPLNAAESSGLHPTDWTAPAAYLPSRMSRLMRAPGDPAARLTLYALRRMAAGGLNDAHAANLMFSALGLAFRRPLLLLRTTMLELSRGSRRRIVLAPCCCARMTIDEARLMTVLRTAPHDEGRALRHLARLTGRRDAAGVLCAAAAYGQALTDLGQPIGRLFPLPRGRL